VGGQLYLLVPAATTTALVSSENPSGFSDLVTFTGAVQTNGITAGDATGTITFLTNGVAFMTNGVTAGTTNVALGTLPRGANLVTAIYSGDANYLASTNSLMQTVTNHPPIAQTMTVTRTAGLSLVISLADLATNWTDVDGDTVTLAGVNLVSTNGVNLMTNSNWIIYTNSPNVNDQISYTISDGQGGLGTGYVNIVVAESVPGAYLINNFTTGATNYVTSYGVPGYTYTLERATNLAPAVWIDISTNAAANNGLINAQDTFWDLGGMPPGSAYYRLKWQP
jgi:hypothetical protein